MEHPETRLYQSRVWVGVRSMVFSLVQQVCEPAVWWYSAVLKQSLFRHIFAHRGRWNQQNEGSL